jgi:hypothetical protein
MNIESQNTMILRYLLSGGTLTALQAKSLFNCMRLAARINDLVNQDYVIIKETIKTRSRKRVTRYSITQ